MSLDKKIEYKSRWKEGLFRKSDLKQSIKRLEEKLFHKLVIYNMELGDLILREHEKRRLIKKIIYEEFGKGLI